jgi:transketolase
VRMAFIQTLVELAERDPAIVLLTADLGYSVLEPFQVRFPKRFFNVGVAEQNMLGIATGLAEAGFIPFVYSIATFLSLRAYEFIRNGPVAHHLRVRVVGIGGGFEYAKEGLTHYALEDIGLMRLQPGLRVLAPADTRQARAVLQSTWNSPGPTYYRLSKDEKTVIPELEGRFEIGRAQTVRTGKDLLILSLGAAAKQAVQLASELQARENISATVMIIASVRPAPKEDLLEKMKTIPRVLSIETHYTQGGLGSLVAEFIADEGLACRLLRCGVLETPTGITGDQESMESRFGLSGTKLFAAASHFVLTPGTRLDDKPKIPQDGSL